MPCPVDMTNFQTCQTVLVKSMIVLPFCQLVRLCLSVSVNLSPFLRGEKDKKERQGISEVHFYSNQKLIILTKSTNFIANEFSSNCQLVLFDSDS